MSDVILLENPRRRRKRRTPPRGAGGRFRKRKSSSRRRRRNPTTAVTAKPRRRRRAPAAAANPRRRRRRSSPKRRRRSNPTMRGAMNRAMGTFQDAGALVLAEFGGDMAARAIVQKVPGVTTLFANMGMGQFAKPITQGLLGLFADPLLRMMRVPTGFRKWFRIGNTASAMIELTAPLRETAKTAMGLEDWATVSDWATVPVGPGPVDVPQPALANGNYGYDLHDWETVGDGDPYSM